MAGLGDIKNAGIVNVNATHIIGTNHSSYKDSLAEILRAIQQDPIAEDTWQKVELNEPSDKVTSNVNEKTEEAELFIE